MTAQPELSVFLNGEMLPHGQAMERLKESGIESAGGFYDVERTFNGRIFKLRQHLERLYRGLSQSHLDPGMAIEGLEATTLRVLEANLPLLPPGGEFAVSQVVGLSAAELREGRRTVHVVVYCQPIDFTDFALGYVRGVRVVTPVTYGVPVRADPDAIKRGIQKTMPLMVDAEGNITECVGANFMFVEDGRIKLPSRTSVLQGVSMLTVMELAASQGIPVDEGEYGLYHVYSAGEAFVTSTRFCMMPVATFNGLTLGNGLPGPITARLQGAWVELVGLDFVQQAVSRLPPDALSTDGP